MGAKPVKKLVKFVDKKIVEPVLEKPYKKVLKETKKIISPPAPKAPTQVTASPSTAAPKEESEVVEATVDTAAGALKRRRKGKKPLVTQPAAANVGGEGASGLNIPTGN
jgi:hypothetical protein